MWDLRVTRECPSRFLLPVGASFQRKQTKQKEQGSFLEKKNSINVEKTESDCLSQERAHRREEAFDIV